MRTTNSTPPAVHACRALRFAGCASLFLLLYSAALVAQQTANASTDTGVTQTQPIHLTLSAAVQLALQHNRHVALAHLAVRDSEQQKKIAQSHFYPNLSNQSSVLHIITSY